MDEPIRMVDGFLDDLLKLDVATARDRLHPRVHLRAVEPGSTLGHIGAAAVVADRARQLACWDHVDVLHRRVWRIADRLGLDLRLHLHHGTERWECEQRLYLDLEDGLIHRIDLLSSGCHRLSHGTATTSPDRGE